MIWPFSTRHDCTVPPALSCCRRQHFARGCARLAQVRGEHLGTFGVACKTPIDARIAVMAQRQGNSLSGRGSSLHQFIGQDRGSVVDTPWPIST